jgi:hypothetical protein
VENLCKDRALKAFSLDEKVLLGLWKVVFGPENQGFPTHKISSLSEKKRTPGRKMYRFNIEISPTKSELCQHK